jgi:hypothetical protein
MKSKVRLIAAITVLGLLSTGCFVLRGFVWKGGRVKVGKQIVLSLLLRPSDNISSRDYPFVLIGLPGDTKKRDPALKVAGPRKFDLKGKFGGPKDLVRDDDLRDWIVDYGLCGETDSPDTRWVLFRTANPVTDRGAVGKTAVSKITFEGVSKDMQTVLIGVGGWDDANDSGTVDGKAEAACNSTAHTTMLVGKLGSEPTTVNADLLEQLQQQ